MAKLVCGCGYLGMRVARKWLAMGETVWATTRQPQRADELSAAGLLPIVNDVTREFVLPVDAQDVETVLFSLGFDRQPHQTIEQVYQEGLRHVVAAIPASVQRFVYISSTGVYGQADGQWVDEDSPCQPTRTGGRACLAAERWLANSPCREKTVVLRLAGLYGDKRIPKLAAVQQGEPIDSPEDGWLNLIHVDDAADIVLAMEERACPPCTLVVADGHPVLRGEFYRELARLLQAPMPRFVATGIHSQSGERASTDKRICNRRLLGLLRSPLRYPTYGHGLAAIVAKTAG